MPKLKHGTILPTKAEEAAIYEGIAADPEARELDDEWFKTAKPAREIFSPQVFASLKKSGRGRPKAENPKVFTAIRLDADLIEAFKATGKGWNTRINAALRQYLNEHPFRV
jgi:uncharacterized protein (DUF4415 family)